MDPQEKILVIKKKVFEKLGVFQGVKKDNLRDYYRIFLKNYEFCKRNLVEHNPFYKQLIPYVLIFHKDRVFLFQRIDQGAEERLYARYSVGIGGHINFEDVTKGDPIYQGMKREFSEEVKCKGIESFKLIALLNDESDSVGLDHLGLVFRTEVINPEVEINEKNKLAGQFVNIGDLDRYYKSMEKWSRIVCKQLILTNVFR